MTDSSLQLDAFIPYRLSFTSTLVSDSIARTYGRLFGISVPEWRVIAWVAQAEGITQQDICARTRMDKMTVSRATAALTKRGLLERMPHAGDRRSHMLVLSAEGRALHAQIAPKALELESRIFSRFDEREVADFVRMLRRIDAAVLELGDDAG
ncbi:MAG TPA: MarR family transcriptional regulator [Novosphingobium sp.]|nr:MarR family transcriptional regulator [Novosphingobium sp.]